MRLIYSKTAIKSLNKLPKYKKKKIVIQISRLKNNPHIGKKLKGKYFGLYSLKIWPQRVIYEVSRNTITITIHKIQHRQGVYK